MTGAGVQGGLNSGEWVAESSEYWENWQCCWGRSLSEDKTVQSGRRMRRVAVITAVGSHWGRGYLDFGGNMLSTLQALRHFAQHLPSRNILFTFGM
jgi:hypothetical protein